MKQKISFVLAAFLILSLYSRSQLPKGKTVKPYFGQPGIKKTIGELQQNHLVKPRAAKGADSFAIKLLKFRLENYPRFFNPVRSEPAEPDANQIVSSDNAGGTTAGKASATLGLNQQIWSNFLATDFYDRQPGWPPDPNGAVSETQVLTLTTATVKVFEKPGVTDPPLLTSTDYSRRLANADLSMSLDEFFSPVLPAGSGITDPHVRYDRLTKRWFLIAVELSPTFQDNLVLIAVSDGERITDNTSFTFYSFHSSLFPYNTSGSAPFLDYPTLGTDKYSVLIGGNQFGADSLLSAGYVIDKQALIHGSLVINPFELGNISFIDGTLKGIIIPQGVYNDDPDAPASFFAGLNRNNSGIVVASISYDKKRPSLTSETIVHTGRFNHPRDNSSPGGLTPVDQLDSRLLAAAIYKNKLTGKSSLWTAHAVGVNQAGTYIFGNDSNFTRQARTGSRWYEIGNIYAKPVLSQMGTLSDGARASGRRAVQYFNPSIAANGQGHAVLGGTTDAFDEYLNVFIAGRYNGDEAGTLQKSVKATHSTAIYAPYVNYLGTHIYIGRWGDFSQTVVDPLDDQTIWTFQEYADVDDSYGLRAVQVKAPPPATPHSFGPLINTIDSYIKLQATSTDNSGFFDPGDDIGGPGYKRLTVKSTGNIIVGDVRFVSPEKLSFRLKTKNKPAGHYSLIITNPDGQFVLVNYELISAPSKQPATDKMLSVPLKPQTDKEPVKYITGTNIFPNPAQDKCTVQVEVARDQKGTIVLLDDNGRQVLERSYDFIKGNNHVELSLGAFSKGAYIAAIYNTDHQIIAAGKILKQ